MNGFWHHTKSYSTQKTINGANLMVVYSMESISSYILEQKSHIFNLPSIYNGKDAKRSDKLRSLLNAPCTFDLRLAREITNDK